MSMRMLCDSVLDSVLISFRRESFGGLFARQRCIAETDAEQRRPVEMAAEMLQVFKKWPKNEKSASARDALGLTRA